MIRLRRPEHEPRIEIMPLIDVIFLLLTFFIYAMVLMVRVDLVPMDLQAFASGAPAEPSPAVTISIRLDGSIWLDREPADLESLLPGVRAARERDPETVFYLALEAGEGITDRAPVLTAVWDRLQGEDLEIRFVGRPAEAAAIDPGPSPG